MDFAMNKFINDARDSKHQPLVEYIRNEVATADDDMIRHIEVPQTTSLFEQKYPLKQYNSKPRNRAYENINIMIWLLLS